MSDFGLFESDEAAQHQPRLAARTAAVKLEAAVDTVRAQYGRFLVGATGVDEFEDRWHLSKADIRAAVEPYVFPNTGTMRRIKNALKQDWKLAHPYKVGGPPIIDLHSNGGETGSSATLRHRDDKENNRYTLKHPGEGFPDNSRILTNYNDTEVMSSDGVHHWASRRQALSHGEAGFGSMPEGDHNHRNQNLKKTYHPSDGNLIPKGNFHEWKDSVDQDGPEKVEAHDFTPGDDSGSDRTASAHEDGYKAGTEDGGRGKGKFNLQNHPRSSESDFAEGYYKGYDGWKNEDKKEASKLVADIYTDFARANGMRVASLDTLDAYASTGIHEADYRLLQSMIIRAAEEAEEEASEGSEDDESDDSDDDTEDSDFGGEEAAEGDSEGDEDEDYGDDDGDGDHDDDDHHDDGEDYDFGGDEGGDETGGGEQYTVPEHAPELDPQMLNEIPHDDTDGSAPVPPEVIDSLLGLPEGTIEQLLLEEVEQGAQGGGDEFGGAPQGGGDDFFGGGGGDNTQPPRMARRRQANDPTLSRTGPLADLAIARQHADETGHKVVLENNGREGYSFNCPECDPSYDGPRVKVPPHGGQDRSYGDGDVNRSFSARQFWAAPDETEEELMSRQKRQQRDAINTKFGPTPQPKPDIRDLYHRAKSGDPEAYAHLKILWNQRGWTAARRFWAAEGDEQQESEGGGGQQAAPAQDPNAMGADPNAMMGGGMMPPPGSQAIQPPPPAAPLENQPAEDQLLDMASQAITQMIDRETQEYQQIIDPLTQALQAVQFAQQVESAEHPLDVTPPQGTVNVDPSQAPAAQAMQQQAARRRQAAGDPYAESYGDIDRGGPSIDDPTSGPTYQRVHPDIEKALRRRFDGGGGAAWHPDKPGVILHDLGNFWDGPSTVKHLGGGELEYTCPYTGRSDRFNADGYYTHEGEHRPWSSDHYSSVRREAKVNGILKNAAYIIARRHGLSEHGYRDIVAAALGRRDYEHILEAVRLAHPAEREDVGGHLAHLFAAGNPRFNKDVWMRAVMASTGRERYQDKAYSGPRDKRRDEHGDDDLQRGLDDWGDEMGDLFGGGGSSKFPNRKSSRGRLPFDRARAAGIREASDPRDRAWDTWASGRDRGSADHGRRDIADGLSDYYDDSEDDPDRYYDEGYIRQYYPEPNGYNSETGASYPDREGDDGSPDYLGLPSQQYATGIDPDMLRRMKPHEYLSSRHTAGETWVHKSINDTFEFENDQPQSRDNMTINDLPKMPGGHVGSSQRVVDRFQRWQNHRQQMGLPNVGGEAGIHNFLQTSKPYKKKVGDEASAMLHRSEGFEPDAPKAPKVKVPKAVNPTLKGKSTKTPAAPKPKVPKAKSSTRQASFFTRRVPGWRWDDHLNGYISKEGRAFTCSCGQKVAAPSYKSCDCGKIWNVYAIGDTHHLASDSAEMFIAREIPVRDNVIMANKKLAQNPHGSEYACDRCRNHVPQNEGNYLDEVDGSDDRVCDDCYRQALHESLLDKAQKWNPDQDQDPFDPRLFGAARKSHRELLAEIKRLADWTKYDDDVDPVAEAYGKSKIPSTKAPRIPRDWSKREPDGKWKNTNFAPKKK